MDTGEVTQLLRAFKEGDRDAFDRLVPLVYDEMRMLARGHLRRTARGQTLDTTGLVHEAYLKLARQQGLDLKDRGHLLAVSACAMRQVVISHARTRAATKRGGGVVPEELDENKIAVQQQAAWLLDLNDVLEALRERNQRLAQVIECRFFAGLSEEETAEALGVSVRTAQRDWMRARAWIREELGAGWKLDKIAAPQ